MIDNMSRRLTHEITQAWRINYTKSGIPAAT